MVFKNFRFQVILRVILLSLSVFLLFFVLNQSQYHLTPILIGLIVLAQVFWLIYYVEKSNRDLTSFLESIRFADFNRTFQNENLGSSFDGLKTAFNNVMDEFQKIRYEKEEHYYYLQNVIHHVGISLIAFRPDGKVEMINNSAKKLFRLPYLKNINTLENFDKNLTKKLLDVKTDENFLVKIDNEDDILQLMVNTTEFKLGGRAIKLVSFQNIQSQLEEKEMEAWQKLIRVLTHEIMNSITPISSLSSTLTNLLQEIRNIISEKELEQFDSETLQDIYDGIITIHKRSNGLLHFVETYRNLTRIPKPNFSIFKVERLFTNIKKIMEVDFKEQNIDFSMSVIPTSLDLTADEDLLEQVLINLVKNSCHALENRESKKIVMKAFQSHRGRNVIQIIDNGPGIPQEVKDRIFIPFYTTKPKGSGIGLSLSRQIMRLHGGTITAQSIPDKEMVFTLRF